jgi:glutathione synthase/RimK-type ligase-like ATP-grasp enzyme
MKLAYVTYQDQGTYASGVENEDLKLIQFLKAKGLNIKEEIWDDPGVDWHEYDMAILKSPWDYFDKIEIFYAWLHKIRDLGLPLLNPVDIVLWNADKHYLKDIANAGLSVTPTLFIEKGESPDLISYFEAFNTDKLIIKPCISGGSKNTFKFTKKDLDELSPKVTTLVKNEGYMVQPFLAEVGHQGEWSFLFFNGKFSHSLLKKAKPGDFRVQHYLGGSIHPGSAPEHLLKSAKEYVKRFAPECLYARVDGLEINGEFTLMELELIEPFLFMFTNTDSYENYYQALKELMVKPPAVHTSGY